MRFDDMVRHALQQCMGLADRSVSEPYLLRRIAGRGRAHNPSKRLQRYGVLRNKAIFVAGSGVLMGWQMPALVMAIGYFLGSVPFGIVLTRLAGAGDLRAIGSGSIGATNVLRTGRKGLAAATVLLDGAKGGVAVWLGHLLLPDGGGAIAGVMAFIGHCYPIWLRFRGGKGVATMLGVTLALNWMVALVFAIVWLSAFALSRISSLGGMSAAISAPISALALQGGDAAIPFGAMAAIVVWRHRPNIIRLLRGEEPRMGASKKA